METNRNCYHYIYGLSLPGSRYKSIIFEYIHVQACVSRFTAVNQNENNINNYHLDSCSALLD